MNMKRQRGRNGGGKPHMPVRPQTYDSSGPDVRIRGNAYQVLEKYLALARDANAVGDRIAAENFYQHAEHYYRMINANNDGQHRHPNQMHPHDPRMGGQPPPIDYRQQQPQMHQPHQQHPQNPQHQPPPQTPVADPGAGPQPIIGPLPGGPPRGEGQSG